MGTHIVNLSLDDEAFEIWGHFPRGTRSRYIRSVLKDADKIREFEELVLLKDKAIHQQRCIIKRLTFSIEENRVFGCGRCRCVCIVGGGWPK